MNTATVIVGTLAAICLIIAYGNQSMVTIQSKNTVSISQIMIFVVTLACGLFVVLGVLTCFSGAIPAGVILSLSNVIVGTFAGIVCWIKFKNSTNAKKHKMTEQEYYDKFVSPKIKS